MTWQVMTTNMTNMTTNMTSQETRRQETCHQELLIFKLILMRTFPKPLLRLSHIFPSTGFTLICASLKLVATLTDDANVLFCCVSFLFPWKSNARINIHFLLCLLFFLLKIYPGHHSTNHGLHGWLGIQKLFNSGMVVDKTTLNFSAWSRIKRQKGDPYCIMPGLWFICWSI